MTAAKDEEGRDMTTDDAARGLPGPVWEAVRGTGLTTRTLDLDGVRDKSAFMDRCAAALALPDWFGRNWDALADCLTDPALTHGARGQLLVVTGWRGYADAAPDDWAAAQEVFADAVAYGREQERGLEIVLAVGPTRTA
ncbi:barstar family protein [Streptomyces sp. NPDC017941]|uniref:barstar family protein n=1 Tax=unclassified Streptomyces TaxID=2593676 RepID=UPI0037AA7795